VLHDEEPIDRAREGREGQRGDAHSDAPTGQGLLVTAGWRRSIERIGPEALESFRPFF
jgi:hypothetical protein